MLAVEQDLRVDAEITFAAVQCGGQRFKRRQRDLPKLRLEKRRGVHRARGAVTAIAVIVRHVRIESVGEAAGQLIAVREA